MVYEFNLPDVGDEESADLLKWMVEEGDGVREDDPVAEVETERAIIEIPSPVDGEVLELCVEERESAEVGETIARFDTEEDGDENREEGGVEILDNEGNAAVDVDAEAAREYAEEKEGLEGGGVASPSTKLLAREVGVDIEEVEGSGADGRVVAQDVLRAAKTKQDEREEQGGRDDDEDGDGTDDEGTGMPQETEEGGKKGTSAGFGGTEQPSEEREITEETTVFGGEDDTTTEGSTAGTAEQESFRGKGAAEGKEETVGRSDKREDEKEKEQEKEDRGGRRRQKEHEDESEEKEEQAPMPEQKRTEVETEAETEQHRPESQPEAPPFVTHRDTADVERLVELSDGTGEKKAQTAFVVKACGVAFERNPLFDVGPDREEKKNEGMEVNVRVAQNRDGVGTVFTVVEGVSQKGIAEIAAEVRGSEGGTFAGRSDEDEVTASADLTVYDTETVGREGTTVAPEGKEGERGGAAVAVGEVRKRPCVVDGGVVPRYTAPLFLTLDRSVADSTQGPEFLEDLRRYIEEPAEMLL